MHVSTRTSLHTIMAISIKQGRTANERSKYPGYIFPIITGKWASSPSKRFCCVTAHAKTGHFDVFYEPSSTKVIVCDIPNSNLIGIEATQVRYPKFQGKLEEIGRAGT